MLPSSGLDVLLIYFEGNPAWSYLYNKKNNKNSRFKLFFFLLKICLGVYLRKKF